MFYSQNGMYYLEIETNDNFNGVFRATPTFLVNRPIQIKKINVGKSLTFFAEVGLNNRNKYQTCLHFNDPNAQLDKNSFKLYASNNHYNPNPLDNDTYEFASEEGIKEDGKWRYCVNGLAGKNQYAYFTVSNEKYQTTQEFVEAYVQSGEPFYFLQTIEMDR